jgi:Holliday junction resolvasome RuvABC endonuclease subunit
MATADATLFLGIDPSPRSTGLALVGSDGSCEVCLVRPPKGWTGAARLGWHRNALATFLGRHEVSGAAIEGPSLGSTNRADDLGQIRGIYLLAIQDLGLTPTVVAPTSLKKYGGGNGGASKEKMVKKAQEKWPGVNFRTDDLADAAWLADLARALKEGTGGLTRVQTSALVVVREGKRKPARASFRIKPTQIDI